MLFLPPFPLFSFSFVCLLFIYILQKRRQAYLDKLNEITNKIKNNNKGNEYNAYLFFKMYLSNFETAHLSHRGTMYTFVHIRFFF